MHSNTNSAFIDLRPAQTGNVAFSVIIGSGQPASGLTTCNEEANGVVNNTVTNPQQAGENQAEKVKGENSISPACPGKIIQVRFVP